jgi:hypothetical protein
MVPVTMTVTEYLKFAGMNPHQFSQKTGYAYGALQKHLKGQSQMTPATARKLHRFDPLLSVADLLGIRDDSVPPGDSSAAA